MNRDATKLKQSFEEDILKDLRMNSCPICDHLEKITAVFFAEWQNRLANDEEAKHQYAHELGFCPLHTWQLASFSSPLGISSGFPRLLRRLSSQLSRGTEKAGDATKALSEIVRGVEDCRLCRLISDKEYSYLVKFGHFLEDPEGSRVYGQSQGACLRHLCQLVLIASSGRVTRFLLSHAANRYEEMAIRMENFVSKRNTLQRYMLTRDEKEVYLRALKSIAGSRNVYTPFKPGL